MPIIDKTKPPNDFIQCEDRANKARISVQICEKCPESEKCKAYLSYKAGEKVP